ncbi:MAG: efflux RND transporter periplasmic adaptor subunit [Muribaculaceae bacterium]|nr:efflux RND transporter periplasmic adaptor subunit [Muribaculaceae bacterium]
MRAKTEKISVVAMLTLAGALVSCGGSEKSAMSQKQAPEIAVMTVSPQDKELSKVYPAIIKGKTDIDIRPQVSGFITKVHVDEGQKVKKGQVLFTLDQIQFKAAVEQAEAAVNSAKVAVANAQITADNQKHLLDKNIISESQYLTAANQLSMAKSQLAQAQAALESAKKNLSYTVVTAPSEGVVGSIPNREGSLASPSSAQPLTTISDNSQVYAYFSLNEKDLLNITENGRYSLEQKLDSMPAVKLRLANGELYAFDGKVATVSGVLDNTTGAAQVRALFDNSNGMLRSGSTGQIIIPEISRDVIVIPQKAVYELQDLRYVYTINDSNKAVGTQIKILDNNDGQTYVVTAGLEPGQEIAIEGVGTLVKEGTTIQPKKAE